ncbi:IQ domain-containing protein F6 [Tiliqua scincoides]|uniref:IQ domain-containing protein F6 n=1 Tax=Tiliqua scincoides TaxID=71010 RepID=UPI003461E7FE
MTPNSLFSIFKSAISVQKWWRGQLVRRSLRHANTCALVIQRWWRHTINRLRNERRVKALVMYVRPEKAAVLVQSVCRMWLARTRYKRYQRAALVIQQNWRHLSFRRYSSACSVNNMADNGIDLNIEIVVG